MFNECLPKSALEYELNNEGMEQLSTSFNNPETTLDKVKSSSKWGNFSCLFSCRKNRRSLAAFKCSVKTRIPSCCGTTSTPPAQGIGSQNRKNWYLPPIISLRETMWQTKLLWLKWASPRAWHQHPLWALLFLWLTHAPYQHCCCSQLFLPWLTL